jgi:thioredoxin-dependent peroxiredoxin
MASTDDLDTNRKFAAENHANFPILSDPDGTIADMYGVKMLGGFARRWTFYIDPAGKILHIDKDVRPLQAGKDMAAHLARLGVPRRK